MCDCKKRLEGLIRDQMADTLPKGSHSFSVHLTGYALVMDNGRATTRQNMVAKFTYMAPLKNGGSKAVKGTTNMLAAYCMFCGEKYPKEKVE